MTEPDLLVALPPQAENFVQLVDPVLDGLVNVSYDVDTMISQRKLQRELCINKRRIVTMFPLIKTAVYWVFFWQKNRMKNFLYKSTQLF